MKKIWMMRGLSLAVGVCLCFSALIAPRLTTAQELKPVLTVKLAGPEELMNVATKIAALADSSREFDAAVSSFKDLRGLNVKNPCVFVLQSDGEEFKSPILYLPIEDFDAVDVPGVEMLKAQLKKDGDGKYLLNSPLGAYEVRKTKGYHVITTLGADDKIADDPTAFLAGLEKYDVAIKVDFENTSLESIEMFLAPFQMLVAMQGGAEAATVLETINEQIAQAHKEIRSFVVGIDMDPTTGAVECGSLILPRKGSEMEKVLAQSKDFKTAFGGFVGGKDTVFSLNSVAIQNPADAETAMNSVEQFFDSMLESIEENEEDEEDGTLAFAEKLAESFKILLRKTLEKGQNDAGFSLDAEGILLAAVTIGDTDEAARFCNLLLDRAKQLHGEDEVAEYLKEYRKLDYATVEEYKLSSIVLPVDALAATFGCPAELDDWTLSVYWGVKANDSVAVAVGADAAKTEAAFKKALAETKNPKPVRQPAFVLALQPLGKLLEKTDLAESDDEFKAVVKTLVEAGPEAKITLSAEVVGQGMAGKVQLDGQTIKVLVDFFKTIAANMPGTDGQLDRSSIREF